jgi:hypothetical protein
MNEKVITRQTEKQVWLTIPRGVNMRWIYEAALQLKTFMKVSITLN